MKSKFIFFIGIVVVLVIGLGVFMNKSSGPSKYEDFARTLVAEGTEFFGAFWCPHCADQEAKFKMSRQTLETMGLYKECSNPNQSQTQICIDNKIETYPSWKFKNGISLASKGEPTICQPRSATVTGVALCDSSASKYYKTWFFPEYQFSIKSPTDPVQENDIWKFPADAMAQGELPLEFIAIQIGYTLPQ